MSKYDSQIRRDTDLRNAKPEYDPDQLRELLSTLRELRHEDPSYSTAAVTVDWAIVQARELGGSEGRQVQRFLADALKEADKINQGDEEPDERKFERAINAALAIVQRLNK